MSPILSVRKLSTGYGKKQVLFDVDLDIMPGETILVTGGNGSGKSTLLKAIYGLLPAWNNDAEIIFRPDPEGPTLSTFPASNNLSNGLAYVPQKNAVFDDLSVEDNLRLAGHILRNKKEFAIRRDEVLASLPALTPLLERKPEKMSGGERQMLALGMTLLHRPKVLLLDEPTAGLDAENVDLFLTLVCDISRRQGLALMIVEHRTIEDSNREVHLRLGRISPSRLIQ